MKAAVFHEANQHIKLNEINEGFARMKQGTLVRQLIDFSAG